MNATPTREVIRRAARTISIKSKNIPKPKVSFLKPAPPKNIPLSLCPQQIDLDLWKPKVKEHSSLQDEPIRFSTVTSMSQKLQKRKVGQAKGGSLIRRLKDLRNKPPELPINSPEAKYTSLTLPDSPPQDSLASLHSSVDTINVSNPIRFTFNRPHTSCEKKKEAPPIVLPKGIKTKKELKGNLIVKPRKGGSDSPKKLRSPTSVEFQTKSSIKIRISKPEKVDFQKISVNRSSEIHRDETFEDKDLQADINDRDMSFQTQTSLSRINNLRSSKMVKAFPGGKASHLPKERPSLIPLSKTFMDLSLESFTNRNSRIITRDELQRSRTFNKESDSSPSGGRSDINSNKSRAERTWKWKGKHGKMEDCL